ncbi:MAG TPA: acetyl-CoA carboxylase biotin carboxyl carrier protein subunit [Cytophagales bacterium]|nr:acetyl-CoA carboxylase biotin carboxyl carrier protein subunit [Cytophagales bacterium]
MFQSKINGKNFEVNSSDDQFTINGKSFEWDLSKISDGNFHILHQNKSYRAEVVKADYATKTFQLKINNKLHTVEVKDKFDLLLEKMGMSGGSSNKVNNIKAPMPGLVIDMKVKVGDAVKAGDPLLILEAMKMENEIRSVNKGIIKEIFVKEGAAVEKGAILFSVEN